MQPTKNTDTPTTFYTVSDISRILRIGRNGAYKLVSCKDFPTIHVGNRIIIPADHFNSWINQQAADGSGGDTNG
jgi:hypothetical protein